MKVLFTLISILLSLLLTSCVSEEERKKEVVVQITDQLCNNITELLSANTTNTTNLDNSNQDIIIALVNLLNIPIEKCCTCVMDNIEEELISKFTYNELVEIQEDNVKQLMVAKKIIENNPTQVKIAKCIKNKMLGKYEEFNNELEDKFKQETKNE